MRLLPLAVLVACQRGEPDDTAPIDVCEPGTHAEGEACVPDACGEAPFGDVQGAVRFVDASAPDGGDGSEATPFRTIAEARGPGVVAVAAGTYGRVALAHEHAGMELRGRCAALVTIDGSDAGVDTYSVDVEGRAADAFALRGVTITGGDSGGLRHRGGALVVEDTRILRAIETGVWASRDATNLVLRRVEVAETQPSARGDYGFGVSAQSGADLLVEASLVRDNRDAGIVAADAGTLVTLRDVEIRGTTPAGETDWGEGINGYGLLAFSGAVVDASGLTLAGNDDGVAVALDDTVLTLRDSRVDDSVNDGLVALEHAALVVERVTVAGGRTGLSARNATVTLTDVAFEAPSVVGLELSDAVAVEATDLVIRDAGEIAAFVDGAGSTLSVDGAEVGGPGRGVQVGAGAALSAVELAISGVSDVGLLVTDGATASLTGGAVGPVASRPDGETGFGVIVQSASALTLDGTALTGATSVGLLASGEGTTATLVDVDVDGVARSSAFLVGIGLMSQYGARVEVTDGSVRAVAGPGALAVKDGALSLDGTTVRQVTFAGLAAALGGSLDATGVTVSDVAADAGLGGGVGVYARGDGEGAPVALTGCDLSGAPLAAVWALDAGPLAVRDTALAGGPGQVISTPAGDTRIHGEALFAAGDTHLEASGGAWRSDVGAAALLHDLASATWDGVTLEGAPDVVAQACGEAPPAVPPGAEVALCPETELPWLDLGLLIDLTETPGE